MIILALDALDHNLTIKYHCGNLMQLEHGPTDISDFTLPRTVVLWAAFLTSRNLEKEIPIETQWDFTVKPEETFLKFFQSYSTTDVPALSLKKENHARERALLKKFFEHEIKIEDYDSLVWKNHEENKRDFFKVMGKFDLLMGYFDFADAVGHLSFGMEEKMAEVYEELEGLAKEVKSSTNEQVLVISDHGMKSLGRYGDHSENGFYSFSEKLGLNLPKITDFYRLMKEKRLR